MHHQVIHQPALLDSALLSMRLTRQVLRQAVRHGTRVMDEVQPEDPPMFGGVLMWAHTVRALRRELVPMGWLACDRHQYARTISPDGRCAIVVAGGDNATGCAFRTPNVRTRKGPATQRAVTENREQLTLPLANPGLPRLCMPWAHVADCLTWILLVRRSGNLAYSELSLPAQTLDSGRVAHWSRRLVLEPIQLTGDPVAGAGARRATSHPANDSLYARSA